MPSQRCHDEAEVHPNEHANRMICGYCSREQNYRPDDCHFCRSILIARVGHGLWEGGKGKTIFFNIIHHHHMIHAPIRQIRWLFVCIGDDVLANDYALHLHQLQLSPRAGVKA